MKTETIICKFCGNEHTYVRTHRPKIYCSKKCGEKYNNRFNRDKEEERKRLASYRKKNPEKTIHSVLKFSANRNSLAFDLTPEWIAKKLNTGRCEMTDMPVNHKQYKKGNKGDRDFLSPSFDRIDNSKGYTKSNLRLVCWGYNLSKNNFTDRDVTAMSLSVVLKSVPKSLRAQLLALLPDSLIACLPSGSPFVSQ